MPGAAREAPASITTTKNYQKPKIANYLVKDHGEFRISSTSLEEHRLASHDDDDERGWAVHPQSEGSAVDPNPIFIYSIPQSRRRQKTIKRKHYLEQRRKRRESANLAEQTQFNRRKTVFFQYTQLGKEEK
jgi:hypothetical protein